MLLKATTRLLIYNFRLSDLFESWRSWTLPFGRLPLCPQVYNLDLITNYDPEQIKTPILWGVLSSSVQTWTCCCVRSAVRIRGTNSGRDAAHALLWASSDMAQNQLPSQIPTKLSNGQTSVGMDELLDLCDIWSTGQWPPCVIVSSTDLQPDLHCTCHINNCAPPRYCSPDTWNFERALVTKRYSHKSWCTLAATFLFTLNLKIARQRMRGVKRTSALSKPSSTTFGRSDSAKMLILAHGFVLNHSNRF